MEHDSEFDQQLHSILQMENAEEAYYALVDLYSSATEAQRQSIRRKWPFGREWQIPDFSILSWELPQGRSPQERIWAALIYISLVCDGHDLRDHVLNVAIVYHHALWAGVPLECFAAAAALSEYSCGRLIEMFIDPNVDDERKSLETWGFTTEVTPQGVMVVGADEDF